MQIVRGVVGSNYPEVLQHALWARYRSCSADGLPPTFKISCHLSCLLLRTRILRFACRRTYGGLLWLQIPAPETDPKQNVRKETKVLSQTRLRQCC